MITSNSSNQVKNVMALQKKSKERKSQGIFVVEGTKMVAEAPKDRVEKVYVQEHFYKENPEYMSALGLGQDQLEIVADSVFAKMCDTQTPQGILALVRMEKYSFEDILGEKADNKDKVVKPLIIGVENLQDPGNMGTILRMGEAAGVTGVIISSNAVDVYNPKTIRSTMGSIYRVPHMYVENFVEALGKLQAKGVKVYAAHLKGEKSYTEQDYREATAFLIGNEGNGLTDEVADKADTYVIIPMEGQVESLNAAIACTVLAFEAGRQRRG